MNPPLRAEYTAPNEEFWAVEDWGALAADFGLLQSQLCAWHAALAGHGRPWEIVRRLYRVAPLMGDLTEDDLRPWTRADLADRFALSLDAIDSELAGTIAFWKRCSAEGRVFAAASSLTQEEKTALTTYSAAAGLSRDFVDQLLAAHGFDKVKGDTFRAEIAARIISLKDHLAAPNRRMQARQIIRMEIQMHGLEEIMAYHDSVLQRFIKEDPEGRTSGPKIEDINSKIADLDERLRAMTKAHSGLLEEIGADEIDLTAKKRIFVETITHVVELCHRYQSDPENWILDGIWTASEIEWLTTPLGERPVQYRMDISVRMHDALKPENFFDPNYVAGKVPRLACERLARIMKHLGQIEIEAAASPDDPSSASAPGEADDGDASGDEAYDEDEEDTSPLPADPLTALPPIDPSKVFIPPSSNTTPIPLQIF